MPEEPRPFNSGTVRVALDREPLYGMIQGLAKMAIERGMAVTDGSGSYHSNEQCIFAATVDMYVSATQYVVESGFDYVTIGGKAYTMSGARRAGVLSHPWCPNCQPDLS